jgi:hypothetical protein
MYERHLVVFKKEDLIIALREYYNKIHDTNYEFHSVIEMNCSNETISIDILDYEDEPKTEEDENII